jgi:hypothetical protein
MSTAITFEEIGRNTDRVTAYALLARAATNGAWLIVRTYELLGALDKLLELVTDDYVQQLTPDQVRWLTTQLQNAHVPLVAVARTADRRVLSIPLLGGLIAKLQDRTEDLADLIENLVLSADAGFHRLVDACRADIKPTSAAHTEG